MQNHVSLEYILYAIPSILIALVIHEFMHAYVGHRLGDTTASEQGRLSLNPMNHIDPFMTVILPIVTIILFGAPFLAAKPVPFNPDHVRFDEFGAALIAAAGPFINLILAVLGALIYNHATLGGGASNFLAIFVAINVALFVFNLLPIPPLDGSRVLYAFAPEPVQDFMDTIEPYGFFIIFALIFVVNIGGFIAGLNNSILNLLP